MIGSEKLDWADRANLKIVSKMTPHQSSPAMPRVRLGITISQDLMLPSNHNLTMLT